MDVRVVAKIHLGDGTETACRLGLMEEIKETRGIPTPLNLNGQMDASALC